MNSKKSVEENKKKMEKRWKQLSSKLMDKREFSFDVTQMNAEQS